MTAKELQRIQFHVPFKSYGKLIGVPLFPLASSFPPFLLLLLLFFRLSNCLHANVSHKNDIFTLYRKKSTIYYPFQACPRGPILLTMVGHLFWTEISYSFLLFFTSFFQGKVPMLSLEALHHLHIFIFVLAVVHVTFSALTILFGGAKVSFPYSCSLLSNFAS